MDAIFSQSLELTYWLQSLGSWLKPVMEFFTFLGEERFYLMVMPVLIWVVDYQLGFRVGVMLLLTSVSASVYLPSEIAWRTEASAPSAFGLSLRDGPPDQKVSSLS